jgi:hypothetical protein
MGEWMYRSTLSWPRHYLEVSGQLHALAALSRKETAPGIHWIGGWVGPRAGLDDLEEKIFLTLLGLEFRPSIVHPIVSRYTDCTILGLTSSRYNIKLIKHGDILASSSYMFLELQYFILWYESIFQRRGDEIVTW